MIHPFNISCQTHNFPYLTYKILNRLRASENTNNNIVRVRLCMYAYNSVTFFFGYKNHDHAQIHDQKMYESKAQIYFHSFKAKKERQLLVNIHSSKSIFAVKIKGKRTRLRGRKDKIRHIKSECSRVL